MAEWHRETCASVLEQLASDAARGLENDQVASRHAQHGPNEIAEMGGRSAWRILWEQLTGAMVVMLIVAAGVSALLHEYTDVVVILAIVTLNAALGFFQDYRAEKALAALKKLAAPVVRVRRQGVVQELSARELVPGDVVLLEVGNYVPADCRLLEAVNLKIQESALTGESEAVEKQTEPVAGEDMPLGDRTNTAYMGTIVDLRSRPGRCDRNRHEHRIGKHCPVAATGGIRIDTAAETAGATRSHVGPGRHWNCRFGVWHGHCSEAKIRG